MVDTSILREISPSLGSIAKTILREWGILGTREYVNCKDSDDNWA